ncbi:MAG TPA: sensor domain-containing diguanylate cyclase [Candidatus Polarisedimenticolia bacterium]|nr:sensor domain-containing diguanylate cyclase [Candidatus Polarisedimenticolia bacterium]
MPSPKILLVTDEPKAAAKLLGVSGRSGFVVLSSARAAEVLAQKKRAFSGVVWHETGAGKSSAALRAAIRLRGDLPFVRLSPKGLRSVGADLVITAVAREARLMHAEHGLAEVKRLAKRQARRLSVLSDISKAANSVLEPQSVMEIVMSRAQELIQAEAWALLLVDETEHTLSFELVTGKKVEAIKNHRIKIGEGVAGWVVQYKKPVIINEARKDRRFDVRLDLVAGLTTRSILCAPLISRGRIIGAAQFLNKRRGKFNDDDLQMVMTLVEPGAIAIENAILYQRSAELTVTDDLTKVSNSRYLNVYLGREIKRSRRYGLPVSLIFLDLDGFKDVNDNHGHLAGSRALFEVGQVLQETVREIDVVSRYGGDEFTIILPQTGAEGAMIIAERIRASLEDRVFLTSFGLEVKLTASFGVSTFPNHGQTKEDLIQRADQAMYLVKDRGKNGVALALEKQRVEKGTL